MRTAQVILLATGLLLAGAVLVPSASACHRGLASTECATSIYDAERKFVEKNANAASAYGGGLPGRANTCTSGLGAPGAPGAGGATQPLAPLQSGLASELQELKTGLQAANPAQEKYGNDAAAAFIDDGWELVRAFYVAESDFAVNAAKGAANVPSLPPQVPQVVVDADYLSGQAGSAVAPPLAAAACGASTPLPSLG